MSNNIGKTVWARWLGRMWPGILIDEKTFNYFSNAPSQKNKGDDYFYIMWLGDQTVTKFQTSTRLNSAVDFEEEFKKHFSPSYYKTNRGYKNAIQFTLNLISQNCGLDFQTPEEHVNWARDGFPCDGFSVLKVVPMTTLLEYLKVVTRDVEEGSDWEYEEVQNESRHKTSKEVESKQFRRVYKPKVLDLELICVACQFPFAKEVKRYPELDRIKHTFFKGYTCHLCSEMAREGLFLEEIDKIFSVCSICFRRSKLFICDNSSCKRTFCEKCILKYYKKEVFENVKDVNIWNCFICHGESYDTVDSKLKPRSITGIRKNIMRLYHAADQIEVDADDAGVKEVISEKIVIPTLKWKPGKEFKNVFTIFYKEDYTGAFLAELNPQCTVYMGMIDDEDLSNERAARNPEKFKALDLKLMVDMKDIEGSIDLVVCVLPKFDVPECSKNKMRLLAHFTRVMRILKRHQKEEAAFIVLVEEIKSLAMPGSLMNVAFPSFKPILFFLGDTFHNSITNFIVWTNLENVYEKSLKCVGRENMTELYPPKFAPGKALPKFKDQNEQKAYFLAMAADIRKNVFRLIFKQMK